MEVDCFVVRKKAANNMKYKFCPLCGKELTQKYSWDEGHVPYCSEDEIMFFDTPTPCIIVAVIKDDKILLLKQSYIFENSKVLLSGYVCSGETVEETVCREVKEEVGLEIDNLKYLGSEYLKSRDIIMLTYMAKYKSGDITKSSEVEWVDWSHIDDALCELNEDIIGKNIVKKILEEMK